MTRVIRSRRAGLSRDQARQQPLYARLLGLQFLAPSGFLCFVFFEGAVSLGVLLALAELVSWWGVLVLPMTVAAMVKLNDVVAGAVAHPNGSAARPVPGGGRGGGRGGAEVGAVAASTGTAARRLPPASSPAQRRAVTQRLAVTQPPVRDDPSASGRWLPETGRPAATRSDPRDEPADYRTWVPGSWAPDSRHSEARLSATRTRPGLSAGDVTGSLNGPPVARQWSAPGEALDSPQQWARQAASRRYE